MVIIKFHPHSYNRTVFKIVFNLPSRQFINETSVSEFWACIVTRDFSAVISVIGSRVKTLGECDNDHLTILWTNKESQ